jgi:hypothetical protein
MRATCIAHLIILDFITLLIVYLVKSKTQCLPLYVILSILLIFISLKFKYLSSTP